jgi:hypothetical protein
MARSEVGDLDLNTASPSSLDDPGPHDFFEVLTRTGEMSGSTAVLPQ